MNQSNLFATNLNCSYCGTDPGAGENPTLWNGFKDADLNVYVCRRCRDRHYQKKKFTDKAGMCSEFPVYAFAGHRNHK